LVPRSEAAVFERDWKTPGDGLLTYDDVNRREWLDLSETILSSQFPGEDPSPQVTRENRYQYVVSETGPDGLFEGFSVGTAADVIALAESAGIDISTLNEDINTIPALALGELLTFTLEASTGAKVAIGLLDEPLYDYLGISLIRPGAEIQIARTQAGLVIGPYHFQYSTSPGVMLYRAAIPEPATVFLISLGAGTLAICQLSKRCLR
jgi:hypothetical protein